MQCSSDCHHDLPAASLFRTRPRLFDELRTVSSFARQLVLGSAWMIAARWAMRLIGLLSTIVLARLLVPEDFGIIAIAMIVVGLLETIAYAGVDLAVMRDGANSREHYDTAWTVQFIQGAIVAALLVAVAPLTATYFSEARATAVVQLMALRCLISGLQNIGIVDFRRHLDFAKEFRFTLYTKLLNFFVLVGAAYTFRNYWAMVLAMASGSVISVLLSYIMHPYRPRISLARVDEIWGFSQWLMISRIGSYLNSRSDSFCVGSVLGTSAMGSYHLASEFSTIPSSELVMPMRRALYPTLARYETDATNFAAAVLSSFAAIAALCLPMCSGLLSLAPELVRLVLGPKWLQIIPLVQLLAMYGIASALVLILEVPLWVKGRTNLSALQTWLELCLLIPLLWLLTHQYGSEGAAAARVAVAFLMVPLMMVLVARTGCAQLWQFAMALWRPLVASIVMAAAVFSVHFDNLPVAILAGLKVALGIVVYTGMLLLLWLIAGRPDGIEADVLKRVKSLIRTASVSS